MAGQHQDRPGTSQTGVGASEPGARAFAWSVWGVMTLAAVALVARFGTDVPIWDDYAWVPTLVGEGPLTPGWLWEQFNEHRIPLPKLILLGVCRLAGNDVRAGMAASVVVLSAISAMLVALAGRLRGGARMSDAIFPLLLLHPGHATNLLWSNQLLQVLPTGLGAAFLIPIARRPTWPGPATAAVAGAGLTLLPLCGGTGLSYVPALALWLLAAAWAEARSGHPGAGRRAAVTALAAAPSLVLSALYLHGFHAGSHPVSPGGILDVARTAVQFLAGGVGAPASWAWPLSGVITLGLASLGLLLLGRAWVFQAEERPRILGLVAFLGAMTAMAGAVGWGRGWAGPLAGFQDRYVTMATPFWCWLVVVVRCYAPPSPGGLVSSTLFAVVCVLLWPNTEVGLACGERNAAAAAALARDIREGMPPYLIVRRHTPFLHPSQDEAYRLLPMLRRARIGPFGALRNAPPLIETRLPVAPTEVRLGHWDAATSTVHVTGVDPQVVFRLPTPRRVAGLRIRYTHANAQGAPARFALAWKQPGQSNYVDTQRVAYWTMPTGEDRQTTVWIGDTLGEFRIQPDNQPCEFHISEIVLLEPSTGSVSPAASRSPGR